jgi:hypothetical protein
MHDGFIQETLGTFKWNVVIYGHSTNTPMNIWELDIGNARINQYLCKPFHAVHEEIQGWKTFRQELVNPLEKLL